MTTPAIPCPWWCTDHRSGETVEDEQHAREFPAPGAAWIAILWGALPADRVELAYAAESYDDSPGDGRRFAAALQHAADVFERIVAEQREAASSGDRPISGRRTP